MQPSTSPAFYEGQCSLSCSGAGAAFFEPPDCGEAGVWLSSLPNTTAETESETQDGHVPTGANLTGQTMYRHEHMKLYKSALPP